MYWRVPGSGKTTVITERVKTLVLAGINPRKILVVTFTKAAAEEMKERYRRMMENVSGRSCAPAQFGTFHAVFFSILKHAYGYSGGSIVTEEEKRQFFRHIIKEYEWDAEDENDLIAQLEAEISLVKGEMMELSHYYSKNCSEEVFREIFGKYQNMLAKLRKIDFDDMLVYCYQLLRERKDILQSWQAQFQYIMIDEFQDINKIQYQIIKLLALPENNLFIVGDDDQSIYRFRGANPEIMLHFKDDYKEAEQILLDINYRCAPSIVKAAARVINHNENRFPKEITAKKTEDGAVHIREFPTGREENSRIAWEIQDYYQKGIPYCETAVLFRTNTQPRRLIQTLMQYNIPFWMKDAVPNIYEHFIGKDIINYVRTALGNRERKLFLQLSNRPKRYINREAFTRPVFDFEQLRIYYEDKRWMLERIDQWEYDLQWLKTLKPYAGITYILKGIGYQDFLKDYADYRRINEEDLYEVMNEIREAAKSFETWEEWFGHIRDYTETLKKQAKERRREKEGVMLSTMHSAKGLEYKNVFIPDANETVIPHRKAFLPADVEEERRMFYVAMTRAKENLHIYYTKERFQKEMEPSRFVEELRENPSH